MFSISPDIPANEPTNSSFEAIYRIVRGLARRIAGRQRGNTTLNPTALAHEVLLALLRKPRNWVDREHFVASSVRIMRHLLIDEARRRKTRDQFRNTPRPDHTTRVTVEDALDIELGLSKLAQFDRRAADTVRLRFYLGLSSQETAEALNVSCATVDRDWDFGRAWLRAALGGPCSTTVKAPDTKS